MNRLRVLLVSIVFVGSCGGEAPSLALEFNGSECIADLPGSVVAGDHTFTLTNNTDRTSLPVYVVQLSDGRSFDELLALQDVAGDYFPLPDWASFAVRDLTVTEVAQDGERQFGFTLEPGDHVVYLWSANPAAIWLCGPLTVSG